MTRVAVYCALVLALTSCPRARQNDASNCVATFLGQADRQSETDEQRAEIRRALEDMLSQSAEELKVRRYADYQGHPGVWKARELLQRYFLSPSRAVFDDDCFYRDVSSAAAHAAVRKQLDLLNGGR